MSPVVYIAPLVLIGFIVLYYVFYFSKIKKAGGMQAAGEAYYREQYGLNPDEKVVAQWVGGFYLGPLLPDTMQSTGGKVVDFITGTTRRGAKIHFAFTDKQRLALSVEAGAEDEHGDRLKAAKGSVGLQHGLGPFAVFGPDPRPRLLDAKEAFGDSPHLPKEKEQPYIINIEGKKAPYSLVQLQGPDGNLTMWVEREWIDRMRSWCNGGPVAVDPRYVQA